MSEAVEDQRERYPLATYNFRVVVGSETMGFSEVSGLTQEYETLIYRDGLSFYEGETVVRFVTPSSEITLKKGVFASAATADIYEWMTSGEKRLLTLDLCDAEGSPVMTWEIKKAMVIKLEAPPFEADANEMAIDTLTLWVSDISVSSTA